MDRFGKRKRGQTDEISRIRRNVRRKEQKRDYSTGVARLEGTRESYALFMAKHIEGNVSYIFEYSSTNSSIVAKISSFHLKQINWSSSTTLLYFDLKYHTRLITTSGKRG